MKKTTFFVFVFLLHHFLLIGQITLNDGNWASKDTVIFNTPEGDMMIRTGDIDNLGFGWPENFSPFSGNNTPSHFYP